MAARGQAAVWDPVRGGYGLDWTQGKAWLGLRAQRRACEGFERGDLLQRRRRPRLWRGVSRCFFFQLLVLTVLLHRFSSLDTPAAMNLLAVSCIGGLVLAILVRGVRPDPHLVRRSARREPSLCRHRHRADRARRCRCGISPNSSCCRALTDIETTPRQPMRLQAARCHAAGRRQPVSRSRTSRRRGAGARLSRYPPHGARALGARGVRHGVARR